MNRFLIGSFNRDERGSIAVWLAGGFAGIMGVGALAVDIGHVYVEEQRLQGTADIAVLAAVKAVKEGKDVEAAALDYVEKNMPVATYGNVMTSSDVVPGVWDAGTRTFTSGAPGANAVQLTLRRSSTNGNAVNTFLAGLIGHEQMNMEVQSVAAFGATCTGTRYMAGETVSMGQDIRVESGVCIYGRDAVQFGQDPYVASGASVGALDLATISTGQSPNIQGELVEADLEPTMANNIDSIIDDLAEGTNLPAQITDVRIVGNLPSSLTSGTVYVVTNSVSINQNHTVSDVIIATRESISFGQDGRLRNSAGACPSGGTAIGLYAAKNISLGQDAEATGVQIVAGQTVTIGQDLTALAASIEAGKDLVIGQDPKLVGCSDAMAIPGSGSGSGVAQLVR